MDDTDLLLIVLLIVLGAIAAFFIIRDLLLWYWKVNHTVSKLENIEELLHEISQKIKPDVDEQDATSNESSNQTKLKRSV